MRAAGGPNHDWMLEFGYLTVFGCSDECYFDHLRTDWNQLASSSTMVSAASWVGTSA